MIGSVLSYVSYGYRVHWITRLLKEICYRLLENFEVGGVEQPWEGRRSEVECSYDWMRAAARGTCFPALITRSACWWDCWIWGIGWDCWAVIWLVTLFLAHWIICQSVDIKTHISKLLLRKKNHLWPGYIHYLDECVRGWLFIDIYVVVL